MNREIKFRGKAIDDGEWLIGDLIHRESKNKSVSNMQIKPFDYGGAYAVDKSTVGQFTGLTDKNGKEIFEGDIILIRCFTAAAEVYMNNNGFWAFMTSKNEDGFMLFDYNNETDCIGNIHDNPELLESE